MCMNMYAYYVMYDMQCGRGPGTDIIGIQY